MTDKLPFPDETKEWTVYGAKWCGYCRAAKQYFSVNEIDFDYHDVDEYGGPTEVLAALRAKGLVSEKHKTIPVSFNKLEFIGGWSDIKNHSSYLGKPKEKKNKLDKLDKDDEYKKLFADVQGKLHADVSDIETKMFMVALKTEVKNQSKKRLKGLQLTMKLRDYFDKMNDKEIKDMWNQTEKRLMEKIERKKQKEAEKLKA